MQQLPSHLTKAFATAYEKIRTGKLRTFIPFLRLFNISGQPMNLKLHYQL